MPLDKEKHSLYLSPPPSLTLYEEIIDVYLKRNGLLVLKQAPPFTDTHKENISNSYALIGLTAPLYIYGMWGGLVDCCCHVLVTVHNLLFIKLQFHQSQLIQGSCHGQKPYVFRSAPLSCAIPTRNPVSFSFNFRHQMSFLLNCPLLTADFPALSAIDAVSTLLEVIYYILLYLATNKVRLLQFSLNYLYSS